MKRKNSYISQDPDFERKFFPAVAVAVPFVVRYCNSGEMNIKTFILEYLFPYIILLEIFFYLIEALEPQSPSEYSAQVTRLMLQSEVKEMRGKVVKYDNRKHEIMNKNEVLFFCDYAPPYDEDNLTDRGFTIAILDDHTSVLAHTIFTFGRSEKVNVFFPLPETAMREIRKRVPMALSLLDQASADVFDSNIDSATMWVKGMKSEKIFCWDAKKKGEQYDIVCKVHQLFSEVLEPYKMEMLPGVFDWTHSSIKPVYEDEIV